MTLIPLAVAGGAGLSALSSQATDNSASQGISADYVPSFFNNEEWRFILAATDRLIPADTNGPGAVSEGVPVFIDKQMELPYGYGHLWYLKGPFAEAVPEMGYQSSLTPRDIYKVGIKAINSFCSEHYQKVFADLDHQQQEALLHQMEGGKLAISGIPSKQFFEQLLENTKEGYLSDPMHGGNQTLASWKLIGFPGARADFLQVMENPDTKYPLGPVSISGKRSV